MRTYLYILVVSLPFALLGGCASEHAGSAPPTDAFHYPVSLAVLESGEGGPNVLYVVSSNFDLLYNRGSVIAIDLDKLGDQPDGPIAAAVDPERGHVWIDSFAGLTAAYRPVSAGAGQRTLFVPTRSDNLLYALKADGPLLSCFSGGEGQDCLSTGIPLAEGETVAEDPFGAAIRGRELFVTHLRRPVVDEEFRNSHLVRIDAESPGAPSFIDIGAAPSEGVVDTPSGLYLTGRSVRDSAGDRSEALRALIGTAIIDTGVTEATRVKETRGVAVSSDGTRLYVVTRGTRNSQNSPAEGPDGLLVIDISTDSATGAARHEVLGFVPMPEGASRVLSVSRPGMRDLVAVACTESDALVIYDDEIGTVARLVEGIAQPYDVVAVTRKAGGKRLFVASFGNHTVDVVDIPDLQRPGEAKLVGQLGTDSEENP